MKRHEYTECEALYQFLTEQKLKETGAFSKGVNKGLDIARSALHNKQITPAADVVPVVHGRWKFDVNPYSHRWNYKCTNCGGWTTDETDYCPNCGAKMDGERKDNA